MQELIKKVASSAGIPEDKAKTAVEATLSHIKSRLPAPLAAQVESALGSGAGAGAGEQMGGLGGGKMGV